MANDYCEVAEIKEELSGTEWTSAYDAVLARTITRASRVLDRFLGRPPGAFYVTANSTLYFNGSGCAEQWIGELAGVPTTVVVAESGVVDNAAGTGGEYTTWTTSDYFVWPWNASYEGRPFLRLDCNIFNGGKSMWYSGPRSVKITGPFGFSQSVQEDVKQATIIQTVRWFKRAQQAYKDVGAIYELGQLQYVSKLDPDIESIVAHLRKITV